MTQAPTKSSDTSADAPSRSTTEKDATGQRAGSTAQYRDRPTDDGMKGDGGQEPNEGTPKLPRQGPSRSAFRKRRTPS
jgi:hypothetical protein